MYIMYNIYIWLYARHNEFIDKYVLMYLGNTPSNHVRSVDDAFGYD